MIILGITTMTDSSACLLVNGKLLFASEEERFSRIKHHRGFPINTIRYILHKYKLKMNDIDVLSIGWNPYELGTRAKYLANTLVTNPKKFYTKISRSLGVLRGSNNDKFHNDGILDLYRVKSIIKNFFDDLPKSIKFYDHHKSHNFSAIYFSKFKDAACLVLDGAGESKCTSLSFFDNEKFTELDSVKLPNSLGHFYSAITGFLGFKMLEDEYKVMGLSAYGLPKYEDLIHEKFLMLKNNSYTLNTDYLDYHLCLSGNFKGKINNEIVSKRIPNSKIQKTHTDLASSAQKCYENVLINISKSLKALTNSKNLIITGGCALNCLANGKILKEKLFENIYIPPFPHDAGASIGAAILAHKELYSLKSKKIIFRSNFNIGAIYSNKNVLQSLKSHNNINYEYFNNYQTLSKIAANKILNEKIICWFQGGAEFGPRALGSRSFLADPRKKETIEYINKVIKKREKFRPFAPAIMREKANDFLKIDHNSPFMTVISDIRDNMIEKIAAVAHIDGTCRPQTVDKKDNIKFWTLINEFRKITGVPLLLNTSFNIQEPIVNSPDDAIETFLKSKVRTLIIGNYIVTKI
jgi:carbamoyltransferase